MKTIEDLLTATENENIERIYNEKQVHLSVNDFITLEKIKNGERVTEKAPGFKKLFEHGIIEKAGRGKVILSRKYYEHTGRKGEYTRRRGLDKETNKQLLIKHLEHHRKGYIEDFIEVLKDVPKYTVNRYLKELKDEETIELIGNPKITKGDKRAFWRLKQ